MKISSIINNPFLLIIFCAILSLLTLIVIDFGFDQFWQFMALIFVYYLLVSLVNNIQLVVRKIVPWNFFLLAPTLTLVLGLFFGIGLDEKLSFASSLIISLSFGGLTIALIEFLMFNQINKTKKFIGKSLEEFIISESPLFPHVIAQPKYIFKDFTANVIRLTGVRKKEAEVLAIGQALVRPSRSAIMSGSAGVAITAAGEKQYGDPRSYLFEIYLDKYPKQNFKVNELGLEFVKRSYLSGQFDDKDLRSIASGINPEFENNMKVIYLFRPSYSEYPQIRLTLSPDYLEGNPQQVYFYIAKLKLMVQ